MDNSGDLDILFRIDSADEGRSDKFLQQWVIGEAGIVVQDAVYETRVFGVGLEPAGEEHEPLGAQPGEVLVESSVRAVQP